MLYSVTGRKFQKGGPAAGMLLSPNRVRVFRTAYIKESADRSDSDTPCLWDMDSSSQRLLRGESIYLWHKGCWVEILPSISTELAVKVKGQGHISPLFHHCYDRKLNNTTKTTDDSKPEELIYVQSHSCHSDIEITVRNKRWSLL